ncbi:DUF3080 domain-containing protein [Halomonas eurihalina]|uniref:DUF3080 domain-containing protein n=1 Tax=Halomonas eurihalina TaxID=42566 RepID=A0A5D9CHK4_HALER|nr:DUF3080 family protein [Halomonas eurihalina]MDR5861235.1 DUF3080 family protein [Halomonas eurihalina]TZG31174.1 DUF3080 domain-containing protein [Halomonas eurihalina]
MKRFPIPTEYRPLWWRLTLALLLSGWLAGCSDGEAERRLQDYQQRLAAALALPPPEPTAPDNIGAFPEHQARRFPLEDLRQGLLDVYALRGCHISNLVAKRNNQLGRVAAPSQRWLYELKLWRRLNACWHTQVPDSLDADDRQRLARLTQLKTERLPRASWNALFDSSEWVDSFSRASSPLPPDALSTVDAQLPALAYLREAAERQFDPGWTPDSATLEHHLNTLRQRPLTAELLRALQLAEQRLTEASALLETTLARAEDCSAPETPDQLPDMMSLNRWLTRLEDQSALWLGAIHDLLEAHPLEPPPAVAAYRQRWLSLDNPKAPWPAMVNARQRHQALRLRLSESCR